MKRLFLRVALLVFGVTILLMATACGVDVKSGVSSNESADSSIKEPAFYEGKTITFIIGFAPGGGVDLGGRLVASHLPRFIPGEPKIVVNNIPGGGGIAAANILYNESAPDGFTIGQPGRGGYQTTAILKDPAVQYELDKFEFIGALGNEDNLIIVADSTGITSFDELIKAPKESVLFGAWQQTNQPYILPYLIQVELTPAIRVVTGYGGSGEVLLALQRGEIQGVALPYSTIMNSISEEINAGKYHIIAKKGTGIDLGFEVTQLEDVISTEGQLLLNFIDPATGLITLAPPGIDPNVLEILQSAYSQMTADPDFLADAAQQKIDVFPFDGKATRKAVESLVNAPENVLNLYKQITN